MLNPIATHFSEEEIENFVSEMLSTSIIRHNTSTFFIPRSLSQDKRWIGRFCMDCRALHQITTKDRFLIPLWMIYQMKCMVLGVIKLDLKHGYDQIRMIKEDIHKTGFRIHKGHQDFLIMPFGLTNSPATFQASMNPLLNFL